MSDLKQKAEEWAIANAPKLPNSCTSCAADGYEAGAQSQAAEIERLKAEANRNGYRNGYDDAVEDDRKGVAETVSKAFKECDQLRAEIEACRKEIELSDKIIAQRDRILNQYPCPVHGPCVAHVLDLLADLQSSREQAERYRKALLERRTCLVCYGDPAPAIEYPKALSPDGRPSEMQEAVEKLYTAADMVGAWMSAAMEDDKVCLEMKIDASELFDALAAYRKARG